MNEVEVAPPGKRPLTTWQVKVEDHIYEVEEGWEPFAVLDGRLFLRRTRTVWVDA